MTFILKFVKCSLKIEQGWKVSRRLSEVKILTGEFDILLSVPRLRFDVLIPAPRGKTREKIQANILKGLSICREQPHPQGHL